MRDRINIGGVWSIFSDCITCGVRYTVPETMWDMQQKDGGFHYCSNGHQQGWGKDSNCENAKLRRERDRLKQQEACLRDRIKEEERRAAAYKGQVTKLKKRASAGVCPCCSRHFTNLERHMATKHPEFGPADLEVIEGGKK